MKISILFRSFPPAQEDFIVYDNIQCFRCKKIERKHLQKIIQSTQIFCLIRSWNPDIKTTIEMKPIKLFLQIFFIVFVLFSYFDMAEGKPQYVKTRCKSKCWTRGKREAVGPRFGGNGGAKDYESNENLDVYKGM